MRATTSTQVKGWKRLFYGVEGFVLLACVYGLALRITWRYDVGEHPNVMAAYRVLSPILFPMLLAFMVACGFLLLVSPFFLRRLRSVALTAWVVAGTALLWAWCLLFVF